MKFSDFRELAGWTLEEAAARIRDGGDERFASVSASLVRKHENGIHFPNPDLVERYAKITDGAVTFDDWNAVRKAARLSAKAEQAA